MLDAGPSLAGVFGVVMASEGGRTLLLRAARSPHLWQFPGGTPRPGEAAIDVLRRELREEIGREIVPGTACVVRLEAEQGHATAQVVYFPLLVEAAFEPALSSEHSSFRWFDEAAIADLSVDSHLDGSDVTVLVHSLAVMGRSALGGRVTVPSRELGR